MRTSGSHNRGASRAGASVRRRFACVGTGGRARILDPAAARFAATSEIVGLCDASLARATYHRERLRAKFGLPDVPVYSAGEFGRRLGAARPDVVVVCTIDREHDRYIIEALRAGCDVITEKPMTVNAGKCAAILAAVRETGRRVREIRGRRDWPRAARDDGVSAQHEPRRRLFPALACREGQLGRPAGAQGHASRL